MKQLKHGLGHKNKAEALACPDCGPRLRKLGVK